MTYIPGPIFVPSENGCRLSVVEDDPAPPFATYDTSLVYYVAYAHDKVVTLENGVWIERQVLPGCSVDLSGVTSNSVYDIFGYYDSSGGVVALEASAAWASNTTRTDSIVRVDGRLVKASDNSRLLLGTVYVDGSNKVAFDIATTIAVSNVYNQVEYSGVRKDGTSSWSETSTSYVRPNSADSDWYVQWVSALEDHVTDFRAKTHVSPGAATYSVFRAGALSSNSAADPQASQSLTPSLSASFDSLTAVKTTTGAGLLYRYALIKVSGGTSTVFGSVGGEDGLSWVQLSGKF